MEQIKHNQDEFGGLQSVRLSAPEIEQRMCARRFCGWPGFLQVEITGENPELYRILCKKHYVMLVMIVAAALGDPSPIAEANRVAEDIGFEMGLTSLDMYNLTDPESFLCAKCGGRLSPETSGMYTGRRWVHTCPERRDSLVG